MDYRLKLIASWGLEILPFKEELYYFIQKNVTRSLNIDDKLIDSWNQLSTYHLKCFYKYNNDSPKNLLDFGCGWILGFPLIMTKYCEKVVASDIKRLARKKINLELEKKLNIPFEKIDYIAPCDISNTNFKDKSFDLITSNSVLEHIPRKLMHKVASECYRLLTDNGICSFHIAHNDHWSHVDNKLHPMNYLKYSEKKWKFLNPPLNYQNRMLQSEYIDIFKTAGFKFEVSSNKTPCDLKVNNYFKKNTQEDFQITHSDFILYK